MRQSKEKSKSMKNSRAFELDREMNLKAAEYSMRIINGEDVDNEMKRVLGEISDRKKPVFVSTDLPGLI